MKLAMTLFLVMILVLAIAVVAYAKNDTCVIHKGQSIWVNSHAVKAHLGHGDRPCNSNDTKDAPGQSSEDPGISNSNITKILTAKYDQGTLRLVWKGPMTGVRICNERMGCWEYEPPEVLTINSKGRHGQLAVSLEPGEYTIYAQGSRSGNEGEIKLRVR